MNILPKKSWHVRTRKNIERVHRDEAEAESRERDKRERHLRAEQEARIRELRARAGIVSEELGRGSQQDQGDSSKQEHFNLFEGWEEHQQSTNVEHEDETRKEKETNQKRAGIWNKFVRSEDIGRAWYCVREVPNTSGSKKPASNITTSMYDPMTAIRNAEEIVRRKRRQARLGGGDADLRASKIESKHNDHDQSSPEIIGEVEAKPKAVRDPEASTSKNEIRIERHHKKKEKKLHKDGHKKHHKKHHHKSKKHSS